MTVAELKELLEYFDDESIVYVADWSEEYMPPAELQRDYLEFK